MLTTQEQNIIAQAKTILASALRKPGAAMTASSTVIDFLRLELAALEHEVFVALFLDNQNRVIEYKELFRGTIDQSAVYPREVAKEALTRNSAAVIFAHNHPSQLAEPSQADKAITTRLASALELLDIRVLDHIIIGGMSSFSFAESGLL